MRLKSENIFQFSFFENEEKIPLVVRQYRNEYRKIGNLLSQNSEIYNIVHRDFRALNKSKKGRRSIFSSENLLHALIIKQKEGINYREACIKISESTFLQDFCKLSMKGSIDYTLLCKAFNAIKPESWELINQHLALQSIKDKKINIDVIRTDSTVVETNIHWPTDSSLLWDTYRVIERMLKKINKIDSNTMLFRFHLKKIKSLHIYVTRYASSNSKKRQRQVIRKMKTLIKRTEIVISNAESVLNISLKAEKAIPLTEKLSTFISSMKKIANNARKRWFKGERVAVEDKVFSIFEPHSELIQRGRREKPIEFGHKIVINQSREKFITGYQVLKKKLDDRALLEKVIEQHETQYGKKPKALAADKGFCPDGDTLSELSESIEFLKIPRCNRDYSDPILVAAQKFRAGIEGSISCLKRAFRLSRCYFKGFKNFSSAVGSAIFCHNLMVLSRQT